MEMIHPDEEVAKQLSMEWDDPHEVLTFGDIGTQTITVPDEDDDFLAGVSACGMSPEECEACT